MRRQILLVDDDPDIRFAIRAILEEEGYGVRCAEDGLHALAVLEEGEMPHAIVLDLMMPNMSGWEFLCEQRRRPGIADIPVAVVTAADESALPAGLASDLLHKPLDVRRLFAFLDRVCAGIYPGGYDEAGAGGLRDAGIDQGPKLGVLGYIGPAIEAAGEIGAPGVSWP